MKPWLPVRHTAVVEELVQLASERSGIKVEYRPDGHQVEQSAKYPGLNLSVRNGMVYTDHEGFLGKFTDEFDRLRALVKIPLDEPILADDDMMIGGYWYVVDGKATECDWFSDDENTGITVAEFKRRFGWNEIRRCDLSGRINRQVAKPEFPLQERVPTDQLPNRWDASGKTINQSARRRRNSNKIKKVK